MLLGFAVRDFPLAFRAANLLLLNPAAGRPDIFADQFVARQ
jgi:hypothetical protein